MTTMTMGRARMEVDWCPRRATVVHGSVLAAIVAGLLALWVTMALMTALLARPVETMTTFDRKGAWGLSDVVWQGTAVMVGTLDAPAARRVR